MNTHRCRTRTLQPTCYPWDYSTLAEDGELLDGSSRVGDARTRLNFALPRYEQVSPRQMAVHSFLTMNELHEAFKSRSKVLLQESKFIVFVNHSVQIRYTSVAGSEEPCLTAVKRNSNTTQHGDRVGTASVEAW
jgi:hypothetical protein